MAENNESHPLHGKNVWDENNLCFKACNIIVTEDDRSHHVGAASISGDVGLFHGDIESVQEKIDEEGWTATECDDFTDDTDELQAEIDAGDYDRMF